ncbi:hypothetical protein Tco_1499812 [Tanacetum coccineum]
MLDHQTHRWRTVHAQEPQSQLVFYEVEHLWEMALTVKSNNVDFRLKFHCLPFLLKRDIVNKSADELTTRWDTEAHVEFQRRGKPLGPLAPFTDSLFDLIEGVVSDDSLGFLDWFFAGVVNLVQGVLSRSAAPLKQFFFIQESL